MKTLWLSLIMIPALLVGCGSTSESTGESHAEMDVVYSMDPPSSWSTMEIPGLKHKIIVGPPFDNFTPNINVVDERFKGSLDEYVEQNLASIEQQFLNFNCTAQEDFLLDSGERAVKLVTNNEQNSRALVQVFYFVSEGDTKFVVTCTKLASDDRDLETEFDASARTFRTQKQ